MSKFSYEDVLTQPERWLTDRQRRWLRPRGLFARTAHTLFYFVNLLFVRLLFRFSVEGRQHLSASGPFIKLIWFPEGARSLDGELHAFKPGLGGILTKCDVPVVPVFIDGAPAAFPTGQTMPRLRARVVVRIGPPETAERLGLKDGGNEDINRVADVLRQRVMQLRDQS